MRKPALILTLLSVWQFLVLAEFPAGASAQVTGDPERGQEIYEKYCLECHGERGRGDGPRAPLLAPRPGNLVSAATSTKSDAELLRIITNGAPRTAMRGWKDELTEEDRLHVLAFIRSLVRFQKPSLTPPPPK
jgi:mono/diheme cytochrome c family protein